MKSIAHLHTKPLMYYRTYVHVVRLQPPDRIDFFAYAKFWNTSEWVGCAAYGSACYLFPFFTLQQHCTPQQGHATSHLHLSTVSFRAHTGVFPCNFQLEYVWQPSITSITPLINSKFKQLLLCVPPCHDVPRARVRQTCVGSFAALDWGCGRG